MPDLNGEVSPLLEIRFELNGKVLKIYDPSGHSFATVVELTEQLDQERKRVGQAQERADRLAERLRALGVDPDE